MTLTKQQHAQAVHRLCIAPAEFRYRKMTSQADNRMRARTAKEQHAAALDALKGPDDIPPPDADGESTTRAGVLL